jgi:hypothetical protein
VFALQDSEGSILELLWSAAVLFFLFGLPAIRAHLERKRKQRWREERGSPGPRGSSEPAETGRDPWEELLRGGEREPTTPEEWAAEEEWAETEPLVTVREVRGAHAPVAEEPLVDFDALQREREAERAPLGGELVAAGDSVFEAGLPSQETAEQPLVEELAHFEPAGLGELEQERIHAEGGVRRLPRATGPPARSSGAVRLGPLGRDDWRRAVVLSELLAPPVSLRGEGSGAGLGTPPGLG